MTEEQRKALQRLLDLCEEADKNDGKLSTTVVRRVVWQVQEQAA